MDVHADAKWLNEQIASVYEQHAKHLDNESDYNVAFRTHLEKPIYDRLRERYLPALQTWWSSYELPNTSDRTIFLYETRSHENLEFLIYNACYYARGWGLTVFCTPANLHTIQHILGERNTVRATIQIIPDNNGDGGYSNNWKSYTEFMKSRYLWEFLHRHGFKHSLMLETDTYLRDFIPDAVREFDYVCAAWPWNSRLPGGSGLTIRRVDKMLEICDRLPELANETVAQDYWAAEGIIRLGGETNNGIFTEAVLLKDPVGVHQWWTFSWMFEKPEDLDIYASYLTLKDI
jgi:Protein of unknown function (DUF5672)